ncbi:uncharacterized protein LOC134842607 [Symsagittifera roscoffensis]|uniref:uncharacterized protein LOC134842607 n=1 Tax=Symsagittifera roscoffensis TaxID=84072 RepID=UPI00307B6139
MVAVAAMFRSYDNPSDVGTRGATDRAQWILSQFYEDDVDDYQELEPMIQSLLSSSSVALTHPPHSSSASHAAGRISVATTSLSHDTSRSFRTLDVTAVWTMLALVFLEKCSGATVLFYYSCRFFANRVDSLSTHQGQILTVLCTMVAMIVCALSSRYQGFHAHRLLWVIIGSLGTVASSVALELMFEVDNQRSSRLLALCGSLSFFFFYTMGPRLALEQVRCEDMCYQKKLRHISLMKKAEWLTLLLVAEIIPPLMDSIGRYFFFIFIGFQLLLLVVYMYRLSSVSNATDGSPH